MEGFIQEQERLELSDEFVSNVKEELDWFKKEIKFRKDEEEAKRIAEEERKKRKAAAKKNKR